MTCWLAERRLSALAVRGEDPDAALERHLAACPNCRAFHAELNALRAGLTTLETPHAAPGLESAVLTRLAQRTPAQAMSLRPVLTLAGGALALTVAVALWRPTGGTHSAPPSAPAIIAPIAQRAPTKPPTMNFESWQQTWRPFLREGGWGVYRRGKIGRVRIATSAPRKRVSTPPTVDDMAYVNGDGFDGYARRAAALLRSRPDPLLSALPEIRGGDTFVAVPVPPLAGVGDAGVASALAAYEQEKQIVDSRLQRAVTVGVKRVAFSDLCAQLAKATDIDITAARGVADEKITLFCKDRPVRDILRLVTRHFGFVWERSGKEGAWSYKLVEPLKVRLLEEELRNRDRNEALLALDREMDAYKNLAGLSPEDARMQAEQVSSNKDRQRLSKYGGSGWGPAQVYMGLGADERDALLGGKSLNYGGGGAAMPENLRKSALESLRGHAFLDLANGGAMIYSDRDSPEARKQKGTSPADAAGMEPTVGLRLQRNELGEFSLMGTTGYSSKGMGGATGVELAKGVSPSAASPDNAEANAAHKNEPAYKRKIALDEARAGKGKLTTADLLEAIHKATGRDVIGDYFTRLYEPDALFKTGQITTFDALNRACDATRLRWSENEKWLTFRSTDFFNMRLKEVPNRLLDRWAARRKEQKMLGADSLREISRLTDFQLDAKGMADGARTLWGLEEWDEVRGENLRPVWRFVDGLPDGPRNAMLGAEGLRFGSLGLDAQAAFLRLTYYPGEEIRQRVEAGAADQALFLRLARASVLLTNDPSRLPPGVISNKPPQRPWYLYARVPADKDRVTMRVTGISSMASSVRPENPEP